jgi:peptidoglycan hydrolase CwlO-like protein
MDDQFDDRDETAGAGHPVRYRRERLPWVLFVVTLLLFMGATLMLVFRLNATQRELTEALGTQAASEAQRKAALNDVAPLKARIDDLDSQVKAVTAQREALTDKVKALELKTAEPAKKPGATPPALPKKSTKKKKK